jgi:hypothetical protein
MTDEHVSRTDAGEKGLRLKRFICLGIVDLVLLVLAFGLVHLINYGHLNISGTSQDLLKIQILVWLGASLFARKFIRIPNLSYIMGSGLISPEIRGQLLKNKTRTYPFRVKHKVCNLTLNLPITSQTQSV